MKLSTSIMILFAIAGTAIAAPVPPTGSAVQTESAVQPPTVDLTATAADPAPVSNATSPSNSSRADEPRKHHKHHKHHKYHGLNAYKLAGDIHARLIVLQGELLAAKSSGHHKGPEGDAVSNSTSPLTPETHAQHAVDKTAKVEHKSEHHQKGKKHHGKLHKILEEVEQLRKEAKHLQELLRHRKHAKSKASHSHADEETAGLTTPPPTDADGSTPAAPPTDTSPGVVPGTADPQLQAHNSPSPPQVAVGRRS